MNLTTEFPKFGNVVMGGPYCLGRVPTLLCLFRGPTITTFLFCAALCVPKSPSITG